MEASSSATTGGPGSSAFAGVAAILAGVFGMLACPLYVLTIGYLAYGDAFGPFGTNPTLRAFIAPLGRLLTPGGDTHFYGKVIGLTYPLLIFAATGFHRHQRRTATFPGKADGIEQAGYVVLITGLSILIVANILDYWAIAPTPRINGWCYFVGNTTACIGSILFGLGHRGTTLLPRWVTTAWIFAGVGFWTMFNATEFTVIDSSSAAIVAPALIGVAVYEVMLASWIAAGVRLVRAPA